MKMEILISYIHPPVCLSFVSRWCMSRIYLLSVCLTRQPLTVVCVLMLQLAVVCSWWPVSSHPLTTLRFVGARCPPPHRKTREMTPALSWSWTAARGGTRPLETPCPPPRVSVLAVCSWGHRRRAPPRTARPLSRLPCRLSLPMTCLPGGATSWRRLATLPTWSTSPELQPSATTPRKSWTRTRCTTWSCSAARQSRSQRFAAETPRTCCHPSQQVSPPWVIFPCKHVVVTSI